MIIVLKQHAPDEKVKAFCNELQTMGYQILWAAIPTFWA